jgi:tape measure domain-containing protein
MPKAELQAKITANAADFNKGINSAKKKVKGLNTSFRGMKTTIAGGFLGVLAIQAVKLAGNMEQTEIAFESFTGSAEKAKNVMSELLEFSTVTPFDPDQVLKAGKALLAFGIKQNQLKHTLRIVGDIASGTGKDFNELALIFGKAKTAGRVMTEDLNQLTEAGIPIISEFAKMFGVAESEIRNMASSGKIHFEHLLKAFENMSGNGGMFFNLMEKQSESFNGKMSTLIGNIKLIGVSIGKYLLPPLQLIIDKMLGVMGAISDIKKSAGISKKIGATGKLVNKTFLEDIIDQPFRALLGQGAVDKVNKMSGEVLSIPADPAAIKGIMLNRAKMDAAKTLPRELMAQLNYNKGDDQVEKAIKGFEKQFNVSVREIERKLDQVGALQ